MNPTRLIAALAVVLGCLAAPARATSVLPPTLDELVQDSAEVIRTHAVATRCEWRGTGEDRRIVTVVSFEVAETIVGKPRSTIELEFLGGEIGRERMFVLGQTAFAAGDEDILFVSRETSALTPLVRMMYGRYLVGTGAGGRALVARANGLPLVATGQIAAPMDDEETARETAAMLLHASPMTPDEFSDAVRASARRQGRTDVSPSSAERQSQ